MIYQQARAVSSRIIPTLRDDYRKGIDFISKETLQLFEDIPAASDIIERIKDDNPKIMRDQLRGLSHLYKKFPVQVWQDAMPTLLKLPSLRVSLIESVLTAYQQRRAIEEIDAEEKGLNPDANSSLDRPLDHYMEVLNHA